MLKSFGMSLVLSLLLFVGCRNQTYHGNERPTSFRSAVDRIPGRVRDSWEQSLFLTPTQVTDRCGQPSLQWLTGSNKSDSEYAIVQTHIVYRDFAAEVIVSRYPNAKREMDRNWFFSGVFAADGGKEYQMEEALKRMPCISDQIAAWHSPPSSLR